MKSGLFAQRGDAGLKGGHCRVRILRDDKEDVTVLHHSAGVLDLGQVLGKIPGEGVLLLLAVGLQIGPGLLFFPSASLPTMTVSGEVIMGKKPKTSVKLSLRMEWVSSTSALAVMP